RSRPASSSPAASAARASGRRKVLEQCALLDAIVFRARQFGIQHSAFCIDMRLSWAVSTDPGLRRSSNEDSYCSRPDLGLFMVADGMGGHAAGEVASRIAVETIQNFISETAGSDRHLTWPFPYEPAISE